MDLLDAPRAVGNALRGVPGGAHDVGPAELLLTAETAQAVRRALDGLSLEYETLLVGKYMDDLSLEDLAAAEDASVDAISSKLARARRAFREAYERQTIPARQTMNHRA